MNRREFLRDAAAAGMFCCVPSAFARIAAKGQSYAVAILGDTHFDVEPESVYHSHYDESNRHAKIQHAEFARNGEMWRERCPALILASASLAKSAPTDFVLQLGDLIQGDCDDVPTHRKMLDDCVKMLRAPYPDGMPFLTVMGNHDFRGKGARKAYLDFVEPFMAKEIVALTGVAAKPIVKYPVFSFWKGPDVWIFCDFEMRDGLATVCDLVERTSEARHVFLVTHGPFTIHPTMFPFWRLAGADGCGVVRQRLYKALSRRHAVVLSGHTHTTNFYRFENEWGGFAEATVNSVWAAPELATAMPIHSRPAEYMPDENKVSESRREEYRRQIGFFKAGLVEYFYSKGAGHYRLEVSDERVALEFYGGAAMTPSQTFRLR